MRIRRPTPSLVVDRRDYQNGRSGRKKPMAPGREKGMALSAADQVNQHMVDRLIAEGALWSRALIAAFRATPRHAFLDRVFQYHRKHGRWRELTRHNLGPE